WCRWCEPQPAICPLLLLAAAVDIVNRASKANRELSCHLKFDENVISQPSRFAVKIQLPAWRLSCPRLLRPRHCERQAPALVGLTGRVDIPMFRRDKTRPISPPGAAVRSQLIGIA